MKPSDFTQFPNMSVMNKCEAEVVALNVMKILKRTGDGFRPLSWKEYEIERKKDGDFNSNLESRYFHDIIDYCESETTAKLFSPVWKSA
jgi:hypothetical protein